MRSSRTTRLRITLFGWAVCVFGPAFALEENASPEAALAEGLTLAAQGYHEEALTALAVAATEGVGLTRAEAVEALASIGHAAATRLSLPIAGRYFEAALLAVPNDAPLTGRLLVALANVRESIGDVARADEAIGLASQQLASARDDCELSAMIQLTRANLSLRSRDYGTAERHVRGISRMTCGTLGADVLRAQAQLTLGAVYRQQGSYTLAEQWYGAALKDLDDKAWPEPLSQSIRADAERSLGELKLYNGGAIVESRRHLLAAASIHAELGEELERAIAESHLAELAHFEGHYAAAIKEYRRLADNFTRMGYAHGSARMAYHLGRAISAASTVELDELIPPVTQPGRTAIEHYELAVTTYQRLDDPEWIWRGLFARAEQERSLGFPTHEVQQTYDRAIATFDGLKDDLAGSAQARDLFGETYRRLYERRIELELAKAEPSWSLIESLASRSRSRELRQNLLRSIDDPECRRVLEDIASAQQMDTLSALERVTGAIPETEPLTNEAEPNDATLIRYYATSRGIEIAVTGPEGRQRLRHCATCPSEAELGDLVIRFVAALRSVAALDDRSELMELSFALHDALISPVSDLITTEKIRIVPSGVTELVPFAALATRDQTGATKFLVQDRIVTVEAIPSKHTGQARLETRSRARIASIVAPRTYNEELAGQPRAEAELQSAIALAGEIERIFPGSQTYTGRSATKANLWRALRNFDVVHIGAHANLTASSPVIELGRNVQDQLNTCEIMKHAEPVGSGLVVLAACNSVIAAARTTFGDRSRLASLAMAFAYLGIPDVIGTLWDVSADGTSGEFMTTFYRNLLESGYQPATALAYAQRQLLQQGGEFAHPFYWAGFVLLTSPRG